MENLAKSLIKKHSVVRKRYLNRDNNVKELVSKIEEIMNMFEDNASYDIDYLRDNISDHRLELGSIILGVNEELISDDILSEEYVYNIVDESIEKIIEFMKRKKKIKFIITEHYIKGHQSDYEFGLESDDESPPRKGKRERENDDISKKMRRMNI